jgi:uncharacterized protein (TIGR03000 family)
MKKRWFALAVGSLALVLAGPWGGALVRGQSVRYGYETSPFASPGVGYAGYTTAAPVTGAPVATHAPYAYAGYGTLYSPGYYGVNYAGYRATTPSSWAAASENYVAFFPPVFTGDSPAAAPAPAPTDTGLNGRPAIVQVEVPANATVLFDGAQTKQGGTMRTYETPALESGYTYHYDVKARWEENGKPVERTRRINVYPGGRITVTFTPPGA